MHLSGTWPEKDSSSYPILTTIGAAAPGLHIAAKLQDNRFHFGGGLPGMEVSWQISGVRHDPSAQLYPQIVEEEKPAAERSTYLVPAAYGQPQERATHYQETHDLPAKGER